MPEPADQTPQQVLDTVAQYFKSQQNIGLDWDYLNEQMGIGKPPNIPAIDGVLANATVAAYPSKLRLLITAKSEYGKAAILIYYGTFTDDGYIPPDKGQPAWRLYAGFNVTHPFTFLKFPVMGDIADGVWGVKAIHLMLTSTDMMASECRSIYIFLNGYPPESDIGNFNYQNPPSPTLKGVRARVRLRCVMEILNDTVVLEVDGWGSKAKGDEAGSGEGSKKWSIGPLHLMRVGLSYTRPQQGNAYIENGQAGPGSSTGGTTAVSLLLGVDASLDFGPLQVLCQNVSAQIDIHPFQIHDFAVHRVEVVGEPAEDTTVGGGLTVAQLDPLNMWGELVFNVEEELQISLMGGYAEVDGVYSLFGFGLFKWPAPVPEPFGIDAIMLGFGYNRDLIIPTVDKLDQFPFIQAAMSFVDPDSGLFHNPFPDDIEDPYGITNTMQTLGTTTAPPDPGAYWLAAGLGFSLARSSLLKGFALLTGRAGNKTRIAAIGQLQISLPPTPFGSSAPKLLFLDCYFDLLINVSSSVVAVDAYVRYDSYVVERKARLTGGLSIRVWWGDKSGQFLASAGGYAPSLNLALYPDFPPVQRLAVSINVDSSQGDKESSMQAGGKSYFAVTQAMVMMGLALQIAGTFTKAIKLWCVLSVDALLHYHPIYYDVRAEVEFGATFRIKVWFVHISVTVHVGADCHLWGPDFSADVTLDLAICHLSFHLGANAQAGLPMAWSAFKAAYLPPVPDTTPKDPQPYSVSDIQVTSSNSISVKRNAADDIGWVVDPETTIITTASVIPCKTWSATLFGGDPLTGNGANTAIGVAPCRILPDDFHAAHTVTIDGPGDSTFKVAPRASNLAPKIWGDASNEPTDPTATVQDALVGLSITPVHPTPDKTLPADAQALLDTDVTLQLQLEAVRMDPSKFSGFDVSGTIDSLVARNNRSALFGALPGVLPEVQLPPITAGDVDVRDFATGPDSRWFIQGTQPAPRLCLLGGSSA